MKGSLSDLINVVKKGEALFPPLLSEIQDCPKQLYYIGDIRSLHEKCVAVVGSRTATSYGKKTAEAIGARLSDKGITVISGMAKGIDSYAHKGCLNAGGKTGAVFGSGPDVCYPAENKMLMQEIIRKGVVVSEYAPGTVPKRCNFPARNRIISGLSEITVVVQARNNSGALITAEFAASQGRDVYTVPGNIDSIYNLGNNKLIKEGANVIVSVDDIFEGVGERKIDKNRAKEVLSPLEFQVLELISENGEMTADEISYRLGKPPGYINPVLAVIEIKGFISSELGKFFLANF